MVTHSVRAMALQIALVISNRGRQREREVDFTPLPDDNDDDGGNKKFHPPIHLLPTPSYTTYM